MDSLGLGGDHFWATWVGGLLSDHLGWILLLDYLGGALLGALLGELRANHLGWGTTGVATGGTTGKPLGLGDPLGLDMSLGWGNHLG